MPNNLIINMRRHDLPDMHSDHAGLFLGRGFKTWARDEEKRNGQVFIKQHNEAAHEHHINASKIEVSKLYNKSYKYWQKKQIENGDNSQCWIGKLENRLFLGMGEASPLEAGITLHHIYGVPFIPGSAIKGVLSHYAKAISIEKAIQQILFGKEANATEKADSGEAGYIIFNHAWWIPDGTSFPLAAEMITVHAEKYYQKKGGEGTPHPDFESPNPNPQIAIQGSFMFSVEGSKEWANYAIKLLQQAMCDWGIGAKGSSGYGYFFDEQRKQKEEQKQQAEAALESAELKEGVYLKKNLRNQSFFIEQSRKTIAMATSLEQKNAINQQLSEAQQSVLNSGKGVKVNAYTNKRELIKIVIMC